MSSRSTTFFQSPVIKCKFCNTKIYIAKAGGKYIPFDAFDDVHHRCSDFGRSLHDEAHLAIERERAAALKKGIVC